MSNGKYDVLDNSNDEKSEANHYDKLSDFEINRNVYEKWTGCHPDNMDELQVGSDYCNNWNDIMPIAYEKKIDLISPYHNDNQWYSSSTADGRVIEQWHSNPMRAIAITYLKMTESEG